MVGNSRSAWIRVVLLFAVAMGSSAGFAVRGQDVPAASSVVPSVIGLSAKDAKAVLQSAGLVVRFQIGKQAPSPQNALKVYEQDPPTGSGAARGTAVTAIVHARVPRPAESGRNTSVVRTSAGPKGGSPVRVPSLIGKSSAQAKAALVAAGLVPKFHAGAKPAPAGKGLTVYAQNPTPGQSLAAGSQVQITIYPRASEGPAGIQNAANLTNDRELKALQARELSLMQSPPDNMTPAQLDKEFAEVRWAIAKRFGTRDPAGAISYARTSLGLDPKHADRWEQLGDLANFSGETTSTADAAAAYTQALAVEPGRHTARLKLACAQLMMGEPAPAVAELELYLRAMDTKATPKEISLYATACATSGQAARGAAFCEARANAGGSSVYRLTWAILENARGGRDKAVQILAQVEKNEGASSPLGAYAGHLRQSYTSALGAGK